MKIVHIASELTPIAKVGGLGDVIQGLSKALIKEGDDVEIILPFYKQIDKKCLKDLEEVKKNAWTARADGLPLILIDFPPGKIYGEKKDLPRFVNFCNEALNFLVERKVSIDILHLHDWMTAICAPLVKTHYKHLIRGVVTTIHNIAYQGICTKEEFKQLAIPEIQMEELQDPKRKDSINLLKGALINSHQVTTVSPTYAEEIQVEQGRGLEPTLKTYHSKITGILNGIDTEFWNPECDTFLGETYIPNPSEIDNVLKSKKTNRKALNKVIHKEFDSTPLFIAVTRLVHQKGPELIEAGIEHVLQKGGQFILLASTPDPALKDEFYALQEAYRDNPHVYFFFAFDEPLSHLAFAAADAILVPSLFEPCGLTQMIALRYGTIPIVHKVGGLKDTIFDIDNDIIPKEKRNGYTFDEPTASSLKRSIDRAFEHLTNDREKWLLMIENGLSQDLSWDHSASLYRSLYDKITQAQ